MTFALDNKKSEKTHSRVASEFATILLAKFDPWVSCVRLCGVSEVTHREERKRAAIPHVQPTSVRQRVGRVVTFQHVDLLSSMQADEAAQRVRVAFAEHQERAKRRT